MVVKIIDSDDGKFRLLLYRREDGTFGYDELYWVEEQVWTPKSGKNLSMGVFASLDLAHQEALELVAWLTREYRAVVWPSGDQNTPGQRVTLRAKSLDEAEKKLQTQFGDNIVFTLGSEYDANKIR